jgi:hypothetical protein
MLVSAQRAPLYSDEIGGGDDAMGGDPFARLPMVCAAAWRCERAHAKEAARGCCHCSCR